MSSSMPWSVVKKHLVGTNAHTLEAWQGDGHHQTVHALLSGGDERFDKEDLRVFFRSLHIGFPDGL